LLADWVRSRCHALHAGYAADTSASTQTLAALRRRIGQRPLSTTEDWEVLQHLPPELRGTRDEPNSAERAVYCALALFALHQQGRRDGSMHVNGVGLGQALHTLAVRSSPDGGVSGAVLRRFQALGAADSFDSSLRHLRGLVTQLRGKSVALDYGQLALDLWNLQSPRLRDRPRVRWGRDFFVPREITEPTTTDEVTTT